MKARDQASTATLFLLIAAPLVGCEEDVIPDGCHGRWYGVDRPEPSVELSVTAIGSCSEADCESGSSCHGYTLPGGPCELVVAIDGSEVCRAIIFDAGCDVGYSVLPDKDSPSDSYICRVSKVDMTREPL